MIQNDWYSLQYYNNTDNVKSNMRDRETRETSAIHSQLQK